MPAAKLLLALALLAGLVLGGAALVAYDRGGAADAGGASGAFAVEVIGPNGPILNATVEATNATALSVLETAAQRAGVPVVTEPYPGMGTYVRAIGGFSARGAAGWIYEVRRDGAWISGDRAADRFALAAGDGLRWRWVDGSV